jgi:cysteine desulfurase/selenocysteine lyase
MNATEQNAPLDVDAIRADFPILAAKVHGDRPLVYLDSTASSQRPRQVIERIAQVYEEEYANVHRGIHWLSERSTELYEDARERVASFIGAASAMEEVVFTQGTTASINLVARSWGDANTSPGDEILLTEMEHHSNIVPWQQLAERTGVALKYLPITDDGRLELDSLDELLTEKVKLVSVTAVSNVLGTINPIEKIVRRAHKVGAIVVLDAAQSVPHLETDVRSLDVDFLAASGHKMLGPSGIGFLYGKRALLEAMPPFMGGGSMIRTVEKGGFTPALLPAKFEAGTPPIAPAIALTAAIDYLDAVGLAAIHRHEVELAAKCIDALSDIDGVHIYGPPADERGGIVSFTLDGIHAHDAAQVLDMRGIAVRAGHHCCMPLHARLGVDATIRASFYLYNTRAEVDALVDGIRAVKRMFGK